MVRNGDRQTRNIFNVSTSILSDNVVTGVFGRPPTDRPGWPLDERSLDDKGARVVEEITKTLETSHGMVSQSQFIVMQRIGLYGAATINGVLNVNLRPRDLSDNDGLIQLAYSWKTALDALVSGPT